MYDVHTPPTSAHPVIVADRHGNIGIGRYVRKIYDPRRNEERDQETWYVDSVLEGRTLTDPVKWLPMAQLARMLLQSDNVLAPEPN